MKLIFALRGVALLWGCAYLKNHFDHPSTVFFEIFIRTSHEQIGFVPLNITAAWSRGPEASFGISGFSGSFWLREKFADKFGTHSFLILQVWGPGIWVPYSFLADSRCYVEGADFVEQNKIWIAKNGLKIGAQAQKQWKRSKIGKNCCLKKVKFLGAQCSSISRCFEKSFCMECFLSKGVLYTEFERNSRTSSLQDFSNLPGFLWDKLLKLQI